MSLRANIGRWWRRRGYGVHSPFVYSLVRALYVERKSSGGAICKSLMDSGVDSGVAAKLEVVIRECSIKEWSVNCFDSSPMAIFIDTPRQEVESIVHQAIEKGTTLALTQQRGVRYSIDNHPSTSIAGRGYILLFNNGLPKQQFEI